MAGLVPAIPILNGATLKTIEITGTRPVMTAVKIRLPQSLLLKPAASQARS
jgi:hypothetical protein